MKIGLVQYNPKWENKEFNKSRIRQLLDIQPDDVDMLIFPELTLTGFTMRSGRFAEAKDGESKNFFATIAEKFACHVFAGMIEDDNGKYFNTLMHINPFGQLLCSYRKIHPFSYSREDKHYESGNGPIITEVNGINIGLSICYDLRFPELYRQYAKKGVEILIDIANWPRDRIEHWYTLLKARAIENQCYMIGLNRVGKGKSIEYNGWSSVFHPFGKELLSIKEIEKVIILEIDTEEVKTTRNKYPFLNDIRLI